jgi:hypothetical protein
MVDIFAERVQYRLYTHLFSDSFYVQYYFLLCLLCNYFVVQSSGCRAEIIMYLIDLYSLFFVAKLRDLCNLFSQRFTKLALISQYSHLTLVINSKVLSFSV